MNKKEDRVDRMFKQSREAKEEPETQSDVEKETLEITKKAEEKVIFVEKRIKTVQFMLRLDEDLREEIKREAFDLRTDMNKYMLGILARRHDLPKKKKGER